MNIKTNHSNSHVDNFAEKVNRLVESYKQSTNQRQFLAENGDTQENRIIWNFLGLNECALNESKRFTFSNGMYIPSINSGLTGRLSMKTIYESSSNPTEFAGKVKELICEQQLMFEPSEEDIKNLHEAYAQYAKEPLHS